MKAPLAAVVSGLGVAQIISWGSLYYPIAVLGKSMQRDLGHACAAVCRVYPMPVDLRHGYWHCR